MILTERLHVSLDGATVLKGIDLMLGRGRLIGLIGPNGAGKSTLLRAVAGLVPASSGTVRIDGEPVSAIAPQRRARLLAYLPQTGPAHWNLSAEALVRLGRLPHRAGPRQDEEAIARAFAATGTAHLRRRDVDTLSGGERARVLLARALAVEAPVLLADEPAAGLDPRQQLLVLGMLRRKAAEGALVIAVLHDLALAGRFCDRLVLMREGALLADGPSGSVLSDASIAAAFQVSVARGERDGAPFVVPWQPL
ncbi:MAG: ABC transporter ATP-binding protein [Pseudochelatococcus sp.]|jgi:iron complex transport system ATP-binding protein|uniref:ABC transporter ATP-binding protein n=1 Tax=Pseudochelatococcus sp. TaxID=2020869 RepID=UPI003D90EBA2